jgi:transcription elongation factor Elf1
MRCCKKAFLVGRVYLSLESSIILTLKLSKLGREKMCPKTSTHKVPHNRIKILVKEAKQMVNGPYYCPKCRKELIQILAAPVFQPIDYYSKFMDMYKKRLWQQKPTPPKS